VQPATPACRQLVARQPGGHHRRRPGRALCADACEALLADPATGTLLFMHAPTAIVPSADIARALLPLATPSRGA
jgi:hypothetical protein